MRVIVGAIWVALLLVGHGIWSAAAIPVTDRAQPRITDAAPEPEPLRLIDLYGNEVERAVTDYRLDLRGDVYERHAPQTALPSPKRPEI